jgi:hypothetical protein
MQPQPSDKKGDPMRTVLRALTRGKYTLLVVVAGLTLAAASVAVAGQGVGGVFNLGVTNTVNAITTLLGTVSGPSLRIDNNSTSTAARALDLQVEQGKPPMTVSSRTRVNNLNADLVDGKHANQLGERQIQGFNQLSDVCNGDELAPSWAECSIINITVPANKSYTVHISSEGSFFENTVAENDVTICASARLSTAAAGSDCTDNNSRGLQVNTGEKEIGAQENLINLDGGASGTSYVLSTAVQATDPLDFEQPDNARTQTTVRITDASGSVPQGLSAGSVKVAKAQERGSK